MLWILVMLWSLTPPKWYFSQLHWYQFILPIAPPYGICLRKKGVHDNNNWSWSIFNKDVEMIKYMKQIQDNFFCAPPFRCEGAAWYNVGHVSIVAMGTSYASIPEWKLWTNSTREVLPDMQFWPTYNHVKPGVQGHHFPWKHKKRSQIFPRGLQ